MPKRMSDRDARLLGIEQQSQMNESFDILSFIREIVEILNKCIT